jgi:hypothetical protein
MSDQSRTTGPSDRNAGFYAGNDGLPPEPPASCDRDAWLAGWGEGWSRRERREARYRFGAPGYGASA